MKSVMNIEFFDPPRIVSGLTLNRINIQHPFHLTGIRYCIDERQRTVNDVLPSARGKGACNNICQRQRPPRLGARAGTGPRTHSFSSASGLGEDQITQLLQEQWRVLIVMIFRTHNHMAGPRR